VVERPVVGPYHGLQACPGIPHRRTSRLQSYGRMRRLIDNSGAVETEPVLQMGGASFKAYACGCLELQFGSVSYESQSVLNVEKQESALRSVVLPEPVPPEMMYQLGIR